MAQAPMLMDSATSAMKKYFEVFMKMKVLRNDWTNFALPGSRKAVRLLGD